jgi:selenocysteine lyase/cysteine desulfurase
MLDTAPPTPDPAHGRGDPPGSTGEDPRAAFSVAPGTTYLDAATYGLLPNPAVAAMTDALAAMASGAGRWVEDWDRPAESCREDFAALSGVATRDVALLPTVAMGVGLVAAGLGPADRVVVPADEFTSVLYPLLVARERGARVDAVPFGDVAGAIAPGTTLVALSLVQMQSGRRAALAAVLEAAERVGARVLLDATQAVPFLDAGEDLSRPDYVLAHGYKHLLCPRGVAFMVVRADRHPDLLPLASNWRSADRPWERFFGGPLAPGEGARRFDASLAWLSWVGARESLALLREWQADGSLERVRSLADALLAGARLRGARGPTVGPGERAASTLVCLAVDDAAAARATLDAAGVRASVRGEAVRLAPHLWNDAADVERALDALGPHLVDG